MIAIISDIHSNLAALTAVVAAARNEGCDRFISLGDVVGYCSQPNECITTLLEIEAINLMGNHDAYIVRNTTCFRSRLVSDIIDRQRAIMSQRSIDYLRQSRQFLTHGGNYFVHGGPADPEGQYLYFIEAAVVPNGYHTLFCGHTHVQFYHNFGAVRFCNPGSVGQPRDGDPRAAFAILSETAIKLFRVTYDIDATISAMKDANYPAKIYDHMWLGSQIGGRIDRIDVIA